MLHEVTTVEFNPLRCPVNTPLADMRVNRLELGVHVAHLSLGHGERNPGLGGAGAVRMAQVMESAVLNLRSLPERVPLLRPGAHRVRGIEALALAVQRISGAAVPLKQRGQQEVLRLVCAEAARPLQQLAHGPDRHRVQADRPRASVCLGG